MRQGRTGGAARSGPARGLSRLERAKPARARYAACAMEDTNKRTRTGAADRGAVVARTGPKESSGGDGAPTRAARQGEAEPASASRPGLPPELYDKIEQRLAAIGEVERVCKSHKKGPGPVRPRCLPAEELVHEKTETIRKGDAQRIHYRCSNAKCAQEIRNDRWDAHVAAATSDRALQEGAAEVLERSMNFAPDGHGRGSVRPRARPGPGGGIICHVLSS